MKTFREVAVGVITWLVLMAFVPVSVWAHHSASVPPVRWDVDNDGLWEAADSIVPISQGGGNWDAQKIARATEGIQKWTAQTDWNPWFDSFPVNQKIWVNGDGPNLHSLCNQTWAQLNQPYAATCTPSMKKANGAWFQITDTDIFVNVGQWGFSWGTTSSNQNPSARGVITHESGHSAHLIDVSWINCDPFGELITMCESAGITETWGLYTLTNDDINSANDMYP